MRRRHGPPARSQGASLSILVAAVIFLDMTFYTSVVPLLPHYSDTLDLSKREAGILTGAYPVGVLAFSLPGGWLAARSDKRYCLAASVLVLGLSCFAFAFATSFAALTLARFIQGVSGSLIFAAGMSWLAHVAPVERRGELLGAALAGGISGALAGPVIGSLASLIGTRAAFLGLTGVAAVLVARVLTIRVEDAPPGAFTPKDLVVALRNPGILLGVWFTVLGALMAGLIEVLVPLRLGSLGASGALIGVVFLVAAACESVGSWALGAGTDRFGPKPPLIIGLSVLVAAGLAFSVADSIAVLALLVVVTFASLSFLWIPSNLLIVGGTESAALDASIGFALFNLFWSTGQAIGAGVGPGLAGMTSDAVAYLVCSALFLAPLVWFRTRRARARWEGGSLLPD